MNKFFLIAALAFACIGTASAQSAGAIAGSASQAGSISGAASTATQGNAQNINFNSPANVVQEITTNGRITHENTGTSTVKTAPQVYAPPMGVTAPCRVAMSAGVSVVGVGVAGGGSVADDPCNLRELSRLYHGVGAQDKAIAVADAALRLECQNPNVAGALGNLCPPTAAQLPASAPASAPVAPAAPVAKVAKVEPTCTTETSASGIKTTTCRK